ncbi:ABC transporter permease [Enterococcus sp. 669A]|uniref:ABC transporter permease n=1 Tax=Candidatus Enterococcus moelleringii TaxID=2815325 RepID=A0ABS3LEY8_9ENTE|nr:ABC transporter permease [Enterococcus sp. 669A]MBO1308188.1 ABC transporter permease [Enterococcus sp. 669A]
MSDFFSQRLKLHQKKMMKYMRYVLNDHFVLVCLFLVGGLGFYYSNLLKELPADFVWGLPIVGLLWLVVLPAGSLVTLIEPADTTFILPKERQMGGYLQKALQYSLTFPFVLIGLISAVSMPLYVVSTGYGFNNMIWIVIMLWLLKYSQLSMARLACYQGTKQKVQQLTLVWYAASIIAILISLYFTPLFGLAAAVLVTLFFNRATKTRDRLLDWEKMADRERSRLYRIYQFINLFTDVPEIEAKVKRRKYLDGLLSRITFKQSNTYLYLFMRRALRGSEYSGLYLRLVAIGGIMIFTLQDFLFATGVAALLIYLIGFQLIPLYGQFDYISFIQLYPVSPKTKQASLQKMIASLLVIAAFIFALIALTQLAVLQSLLMLAILIVETVLFVWLYVPIRIKKMEE